MPNYLPAIALFTLSIFVAPEAFAQTGDPAVRRDLNRRFDLLDSLLRKQQYADALPIADTLFALTKALVGAATVDTLYTRALHSRGRTLYYNGKYETAAACHEEAWQLRRQLYGPESLAAAVSLSNLGICMYELRELNKAIDYQQQALDIYLKQNKLPLVAMGDAWNNLANAQADNGDDEAALVSYNKAIEIRYGLEGPNSPGMADLMQNMAGCYISLNQLDSAIMGYQSAIQIYKTLGLKPISEANAWYNLGVCCQITGDLEFSQYCQEQALDLRKKNLKKDHPAILTAERGLALTFLKLGDYERADYHLNGVLEARRRTKSPQIANSLSDVSSLAKHFGDWGKAERTIREAIGMVRSAEKPDSMSMGRFLGNYGNLLLEMGNLDSALLLHRQSFGYFPRNKAGEAAMANSYGAIASCYLAKNDFQTADSLTRLSIKILDAPAKKNVALLSTTLRQLASIQRRQGHFQAADTSLSQVFRLLEINAEDTLHWDKVKSPSELASTLIDMAELQYQWSLADGSIDGYKNALDWGQKALSYISHWEIKLAASSSRRETRKMARSARDLCTASAFHLKRLDTDHRDYWLQHAFEFMEGAHNSQLRDAVLEAKSKRISEKKDSLEEQKNRLWLQIAGTEKEIYLMKQAGLAETDSLLSNATLLLFEQKKQLDGIKTTDSLAAPRLQKAPLIADVQRNLRKGQSLLEYQLTDSCVFVFWANQQDADMMMLPLPKDLAAMTTKMRRGITGFYTLSDEASLKTGDWLYDSTLNDYVEAAVWLNQHFLKPLEQKTGPDKDLLIIPDGLLALVPFDALLDSQPKDLDDFETFPFLARRKNIGLAFSAALQLEMSEPVVNPNTSAGSALIMAPFFRGNPNELSQKTYKTNNTRTPPNALPYSGREAYLVRKAWGNGKTLFGASATLDAYLRDASNCLLHHLCTHAAADGRYGLYCYVLFSKGDTSVEKLYARDIYKLELRVDMVTLSACESGLGELQPEEGVIGLTRAFAFAGAKSIVSSLWKVTDQSTSELMAMFYTNLTTNNLSKDQALGHAKRDFLNDTNILNATKHPFFWAGFNIVGSQHVRR